MNDTKLEMHDAYLTRFDYPPGFFKINIHLILQNIALHSFMTILPGFYIIYNFCITKKLDQNQCTCYKLFSIIIINFEDLFVCNHVSHNLSLPAYLPKFGFL